MASRTPKARGKKRGSRRRARARPARSSGPMETITAHWETVRSGVTEWVKGIQPPTRRQFEYGGLVVLAVSLAITGIVVRATRETGTKRLVVERIAHLREPVGLAQPPGRSEVVVVEKKGVLRVVGDSGVVGRPMLDIRKSVKTSGRGGEQGMLSVAFPRISPRRGCSTSPIRTDATTSWSSSTGPGTQPPSPPPRTAAASC